jgi:hypothetical protein
MRAMRDVVNGRATRAASSAYRHAGLSSKDAKVAALLAGTFPVSLSHPEQMEALWQSVEEVTRVAADPANDNRVEIFAWLISLVIRLGQIIETAASALEASAARRVAFTVLLVIVPMILSHIDTDASERRMINKIEDVSEQEKDYNEKVSRKLDELNRQIFKLKSDLAKSHEVEGAYTFYVVARATPLCAAKRFHCSSVAILRPGVEVQLLERSGKWIRIAAVLNSESVAEGWVLKKYLRIRR